MRKRKDESEESEQDDDDNQYDDEKIQIRKPKIDRIDKFKNLKKIIINVSMTQYPVVTEVAESLGWKVQTSNDAGDWDVYWTDFSIDPDVLIKMHHFQKINHYPGIHMIARKNLLGENLTNMSERFPDQYNFFPMTWLLPQQYSEFRNYYESKQKGKTRTYIVKPQADCQGRGIFLTRRIQDMQTGKHYVVQRYMAKPYLLDGLKFDFRIYVLMCGTDPLKLYMYNQGLARLATQLYQQPMNANLDRLCMHLTNYAINKHSPNFIFNNNVNNMGIGHKRALSCVFKQLSQRGLDMDTVKQKIKDIIIKTIISGLPLMSHQYKFSQPQDYSGNMCFHILGLDVMLNSKGDPFVIQVNHTPSFTTDTPLDQKIKFNLIRDTLVIMNVNTKQKNQLINRCKQYNSERLITGKRHIYEGQDRKQKIKQAQEEREKYQTKHLGGFQKIYPLDDPEKNRKYQEMIAASMNIYMAENQAVRARYQDKQMKKMMRSQIRAKKMNDKEKEQKMKKNEESCSQEIDLLRQSNPQKIEKQIVISANNSPRQANLTLSQPAPFIHRDQDIEIEEQDTLSVPIKKQIKGDSKPNQNLIYAGKQKVNQIRKMLGRENSLTAVADRKDRMIKIVDQYENKLLKSELYNRGISKRSTPSQEINKINRNRTGLHKQLPNIESVGGFSHVYAELIQQQILSKSKKTDKSVSYHNKFMLKSQPKPSKLMESIEKQTKNKYKKLFSLNSGEYVMPKVFLINVDDKKQKEKDKAIHFITMGRKGQNNTNTAFANNA